MSKPTPNPRRATVTHVIAIQTAIIGGKEYGQEFTVHRGQTYRSNDPAVIAAPQLFLASPASEAELATAAAAIEAEALRREIAAGNRGGI